jgi:hypothetical protein
MVPAVDDRRLTNRIMAKWSAISAEPRMPRPGEITESAFGADWSSCVLIALEPVLWRSRLVYVGDTLRNRDRTAGIPQILNDYQEGSLVRLAAAKIPALLERRAPMIFGGYAPRGREVILYRAILLPVSSDNQRIDHALGAINFRAVSVNEDDVIGDAVGEADKGEQVAAFFALTAGRLAFPDAGKPSVKPKRFRK